MIPTPSEFAKKHVEFCPDYFPTQNAKEVELAQFAEWRDAQIAAALEELRNDWLVYYNEVGERPKGNAQDKLVDAATRNAVSVFVTELKEVIDKLRGGA